MIMADKFSPKPDRFDRHPSPERKEETHKAEKDEISEKAREFIEGVGEVVEGVEEAEFVEGEVAEQIGEGKKKVATGMPAKAQGAATQAQKPVIPPSIDVMRTQIAVQIKKEIIILEREAKRIMTSPGKFSPFKLNGVVSKIRELSEMLAGLAFASAASIKNWWLKLVKGITIS
jgi:hypothetical protein